MTSNKLIVPPKSWTGQAISPKTGKPYREHTKNQSMAVRRNFALMNLAGMQVQIYTVYNCLTQSRTRIRASIKLSHIHKLLEELKQVVKDDYDQLKKNRAILEKETPEKGGT